MCDGEEGLRSFHKGLSLYLKEAKEDHHIGYPPYPDSRHFRDLSCYPFPQYKATASVRVERITDVTGFLMEVISYPLGDVLQGQMELIKSFDVMERVAKLLGLIPRDATDEEVSTNEKYRNAISSLSSAITVERQGQSNIIAISATAAALKRPSS